MKWPHTAHAGVLASHSARAGGLTAKMKWPHTAHAGVLAALRCACGYQAIARIGGVNAPPGDEGLDGITNVNNQAPNHGLARTKRPGLEEAALRFPQMQACSQKALLHKVPHVTAPA